MLNKVTFSKGIGKLAELTTTVLTEARLEIWYEALQDLTDQEFTYAVQKLCRGWKYGRLPLPSEIIDAVGGNIDDKPVLAYETFISGKAKTGPYKTVIFDDKTIHGVVMAMGGWEAVCLITEDEWKFRRKEFIELYRAFIRHPRQGIPEKLAGIIERTNSAMEFDLPAPVYITSSGLSEIPLLREPDSEIKAIEG